MLDARRSPPAIRSPSPLCAPVFWAALALLVLNDHWLKGAGVLPAVLTGKLSDLAGLIVGPVVAAELCRGRFARLRGAAAAAVVLAFVATELSPTCAHAVERAAAALGVRVRLWPDPSDLLALAVLPLTFHLLGWTRAGSLAPIERAALVAGALACLATSDNAPYIHGPFLVNHTGGVLEVRVRWYDGPAPACDAPLADVAADVERAPQPAEHVLRLQPTEIAGLSRAPEGALHVERRCPHEADAYGPDAADLPECVVLQLHGEGIAYLVRARRIWESETERSRCAPTIPVYEQPGQGALVVGRSEQGALRLVPHKYVELMALD